MTRVDDVLLRSRLDPAGEAFALQRQGVPGPRRRPARPPRRRAPRRPGASRERHVARGKLLPRDRVDALLDPGSPFLELSPLAAHGMYDDEAPGAGIITGIGRVPGRECVIVANDATVKGGTYYPMTVKKHLRAQEVALQNRLPCVYLVDSGGAFLPEQDEVFPDREHFGRIFYNQATMSARGIPQIAAVLGLVHRGRRVRAGDERRGRDRPRPGHDLPRRPAAGEGRDRRGRDGRGPRRRRPARAHLRRHRPPRRRRRARAARSSAASSRPSARARPRRGSVVPVEEPALRPGRAVRRRARRPAHPVRRARGDRAPGRRQPVRRSSRREYGATLVTGFAHIHGHPVGIVANNGVLFCESALKGAHFIELCDQRSIPLLFLQNITGFMVGRRVRGRRHRQARRQDGHRRRLRAGAQAHRGHRRLVRRRQLLDVRAGLLAAVPVDVAERPHLGHGRRAGARRVLADGGRGEGAGRRRRCRRRSASSTRRRATPTTPPPGCGTTASSTRSTPGPSLGLALSRLRATHRWTRSAYGVFRM